MKEFEHLMQVWQGQPTREKLSVEDVLKQVKKGMGLLARRLMLGLVVIAVTTAIVIYLAVFGAFTSWTSHVGLLILTAGMVMYLTLQIGDYRTIARHDPTLDPANYLNTLKIYQRRRAHLYGWFWYAFAMIVTAGMSLYTFEVLQGQTLPVKIISYSFWTAYILFATFYLKDRIVKHENEKVDLMIERLERLKNQFD
jgi:hypothetical protein